MNIGIIEQLIYSLIATFLLVIGTIHIKKNNHKIRNKKAFLLICSLLTILVHFSGLFYNLVVLKITIIENRYVFAIYPCNVVMYLCLICALLKNKESKVFKALSEFCLLAGTIFSMFGMYLNPDILWSGTIFNYTVFKALVAHTLMGFNCLMFYALGYYEFDLKRNLKSLLNGSLMLLVIGLYNDYVYIFIDRITEYTYSSLLNLNSMWIFGMPDYEWINLFSCTALGLFVYYLVFKIIDRKKKKKVN